ncbi:MAG: universal stress protein [Deltaproteobacteria bacterium]|jgi:nucleotide-binding universal stress UspA family protein|nr:universal stress protein [Deltaproteobacteria bacterium]
MLTDHLALAIDFSEASKVALAAAFGLAKATGCPRITVFHAVQEVVEPKGETAESKARCQALRAKIQEAAERQLEAMTQQVGPPAGVNIVHEVIRGTPSRAVPAAAERVGATLLAAGTHGRTGLNRWLKGSVAEALVRGSPLPTLVMPMGKDGVPPVDELRGLSRVLIAVDLHAEAERVLQHGLDLAARLAPGAVAVTLLTVADPMALPEIADDDRVLSEYREMIESEAETQLATLAQRFSTPQLSITPQVTAGDPDEQILETLRVTRAELVVVGSHGRGRAPIFELGSTTTHVMRESPVSVLVVPLPSAASRD